MRDRTRPVPRGGHRVVGDRGRRFRHDQPPNGPRARRRPPRRSSSTGSRSRAALVDESVMPGSCEASRPRSDAAMQDDGNPHPPGEPRRSAGPSGRGPVINGGDSTPTAAGASRPPPTVPPRGAGPGRLAGVAAGACVRAAAACRRSFRRRGRSSVCPPTRAGFSAVSASSECAAVLAVLPEYLSPVCPAPGPGFPVVNRLVRRAGSFRLADIGRLLVTVRRLLPLCRWRRVVNARLLSA